MATSFNCVLVKYLFCRLLICNEHIFLPQGRIITAASRWYLLINSFSARVSFEQEILHSHGSCDKHEIIHLKNNIVVCFRRKITYIKFTVNKDEFN